MAGGTVDFANAGFQFVCKPVVTMRATHIAGVDNIVKGGTAVVAAIHACQGVHGRQPGPQEVAEEAALKHRAKAHIAVHGLQDA